MIFQSNFFPHIFTFLQVLCILAVSNCAFSRDEPKSLLRFLRRYEKTSLQQISPLSQKRPMSSRPSVILTFKAYGRTFELKLSRQSLPETAVKIYGKHGFLIQSSSSKAYNGSLYVGIVNGDSTSRVEGLFMEIGFRSIVEFGEETYYVEPAALYFEEVCSTNSTIVYRASDTLKCENISSENISCSRLVDYADFPVVGDTTSESYPQTQDYNKSVSYNLISHSNRKPRRRRNRCEIELVADHTYVAHMNFNTKDVITMLYFHAKRADRIFKAADFDLDGYPDGVRIIPKQIVIYPDEEAPNYPLADFTSNDASDFILTFSRRIQVFCVSICFCHRAFEDDIVGMAYRANPYKPHSRGGICQKPKQFKDGTGYTANTAIVSSRGPQGSLPFLLTVHSFIHELGHSFGSDHDPSDNEVCSPGNEHGNFIMTPYTIDGTKKHHSKFSPCSSEAIQKAIDKFGECLESSKTPTCGNGIREEGEECDCGSTFTCQDIDPCCTPRGGFGSDRECTLRRDLKAQCSYVESPCCNHKCEIVGSSANRICYSEGTECQKSACDGLSAECPPGSLIENGTPCRGTSRTCRDGMCNSTVCLDNGMENCHCRNKHNECHVCCFDETSNTCRTSKTLGLIISKGTFFLKPAGTSCNQGIGMCDRRGHCLTRTSASEEVSISTYTWQAIIIITSFLSFIALFSICFSIRSCVSRIPRKCNIYVLSVRENDQTNT